MTIALKQGQRGAGAAEPAQRGGHRPTLEARRPARAGEGPGRALRGRRRVHRRAGGRARLADRSDGHRRDAAPATGVVPGRAAALAAVAPPGAPEPSSATRSRRAPMAAERAGAIAARGALLALAGGRGRRRARRPAAVGGKTGAGPAVVGDAAAAAAQTLERQGLRGRRVERVTRDEPDGQRHRPEPARRRRRPTRARRSRLTVSGGPGDGRGPRASRTRRGAPRASDCVERRASSVDERSQADDTIAKDHVIQHGARQRERTRQGLAR